MAEEERKGEEEEEHAEERLLHDDMAVLDFDMLCAAVAARAQGLSFEGDDKDGEGEEVGGVQRMWEGGVLDCLEDRRIAIEAACCPCYRFGKNMERANLGGCWLQGTMYVIIFCAALSSFILLAVMGRLWFLYVGIGFIVMLGTYLGYFRRRIRKLFNIRGGSGSFDDCMHHLICSCCSLCQEARTLEMNNVQAGMWRGRGDTICIGASTEASKNLPTFYQTELTKLPYPNSMQRDGTVNDHKWTIASGHSEPLVSMAASDPLE